MVLLLWGCQAATTDTGIKESGAALFADGDGDGFGNPDTPDTVGVANALDCDDSDAERHPGADEHCDGVDEDCDGVADNDAVDPSTWYADADGDGTGDPASPIEGCTAPAGAVADNTDCDDADTGRLPGAVDVCEDGVDQDCDGADLECHEIRLAPIDEASPRWVGATPNAFFGDTVAISPGSASLADVLVSGVEDEDGDGVVVGSVHVIRGARVVQRQDLPTESGCSFLGSDGTNAVPGHIGGTAHLNGQDSLTTAIQFTGEAHWLDVYDGDLCARSSLEDYSLRLSPTQLSGNFGISTTSVRDGDERPLLAVGGVGAIEADDGWWDGSGAVFLYDLSSGTSDLVGTLLAARWMQYQYFGLSLAAGDMDGDGIDDLAVGAPATDMYDDRGDWSSGRVYVFSGPFDGDRTAIDDSGNVQDAALMLYRDGIGLTDSIGQSVSVGDVDGDGYGDLLAGAPDLWYGYGRAYLVVGPPDGERAAEDADAWFGPEPQAVYSGFGSQVTAASDLDGDGAADVAFGTPYLDSDGEFHEGTDFAGGLYLCYGRRFSGGVTLDDMDELRQGIAGTGLGYSLAGGADIDGDGFQDLVVGAPLSDGGLGAVFPIYGG